MSKLHISIVIPTLNEAKYIGNILSQLDNEAYKKKYGYEIIVADCHSSDKTVHIAKKFNVRIAYTQKGIQPNAALARISGAQLATGKVLVFIDADGTIEDVDMLLTSAQSIAKGKYGCFNCSIDVHSDEAIWKDRIFQCGINLFVRVITVFGFGNGRGICMGIRRDIYEKIGGFNPDLDASEDYELFVRARKYTKVRHFSKVVVYESPRRYRVKGYFVILRGWLLNTASVMIKKKSATKWERVDY